MGWELRRGKPVYYRKVREAAGRVRSVYCGAGERGEAAAREDEMRRALKGTPFKPDNPIQPGAAACAMPQSWPTVLDVVVANGNYHTLLARYAPHTIPRDDEPLVAWYARRVEACG